MSAKTNLNIRISQDLKAKLEKLAADAGVNLSDYMRDHLQDILKIEGATLSFEGASQTPSPGIIIPEKQTDLADRIKKALADAIELRTFMSTLGINLSGTPQQQQPYYSPWGYSPPQTPEKKDIMTVVAEIKALESLGKQTGDPQVIEALREVKDTLVKTLQQPPTSTKSDIRQRLDDLKEYAMTMRIFGTPEEAKKADDLFRNELNELRTALHKAELDAVKSASEYQRQDFQRQIDEIRTAPTELDQVTKMSELAEKDAAIRAYMNTKLGIKKEESLTPEKLKGYIESIKVPVGDIIKGVVNFAQQRGRVAAPPPPPTMPPYDEPPSEEQLAARAGITLHRAPEEQTMGTFALPEETQLETFPEETGLPPEEETGSPPSEEKPPPKPKGAKKK